MKKFWKGLKRRYIEGIEWMKLDEALASMMYLATTIRGILFLCKVTPGNAMQYAKTVGVNLVFIYLFSMVTSASIQNKLVYLFRFVVMTLFVALSVGRGLNYWYLTALFVVPIIVAIGMIYVQENYVGFEDFINLKNIGNFGTVVLTTLIPVLTITVPLIFLEWSIFAEIAIVAAL